MDLRDHFERTWKARGRLLNAFQTLTPEEWAREFEFSFKSVQRLLAHIVEVERGWTQGEILMGQVERLSDEEWKRIYATWDGARARSREIMDQTRRVLEEYVPARLAETRQGEDLEGVPATFTVEEILVHVYTHELRHQGQLQAMLRLLGKPAPNLDWI